jgi:multiple sugar transport system substrate-binding protein
MKARFTRLLGIGSLACLILSLVACAGAAPAATQVPGTSAPAETAPSGAGGVKELTIAGIAGTYLDPLDAVGKSFTEKTGIKITLLRYPYDTLVEKTHSIVESQLPDVDLFFFDESQVPYMASGGYLVPLDKDYGYQRDDQKIWAVAQDLGVWPPPYGPVPPMERGKEQHIYGVPSIVNNTVFYVNKAILAENGIQIPDKWTWDDVLDICKQVYDPNKPQYCFVMRGVKGDPITYSWVAMMWSMGGDLLDDNWNPVINSPATIDAAKLTAEIMKYGPPGWGAYSDTEQATDTISGRAIMGLMWPAGSFFYDMEDPAKCQYAGQFGYYAIPEGKGGSVANLGHWEIGISAFSTKKDAAWQFLQYFLEDSTALEYAKAGGWPGNISVYSQEPLKSIPWSAALAQTLTDRTTARWVPRTTVWYEMENAEGPFLNQVLTGQMDAKEGLDQAAAAMRSVLETAGYYK